MLIHWQRNVGLLLLFFLLVLAVGYAYERLGERRDARLNPPPGRLIQVGDRKLHILCKGDTGPTIVIEQGAGELSRYWWPVQDEIAGFARVCTYDRAGFAWSDPAPGERTIEDRVQDLHALLANAAIPGPYILVAHSYGGLIVRSYALSYPSEVAGLVLVDTPEESSIFQPGVLDFYAKARTMNRFIGTVSRFGVLRLLRHWVPLDRYGLWLTTPDEYAALCDDIRSIEQVPAALRTSKSAGSLGALPVVVITHGIEFPGPFAILETNWISGQKQLAALSTNSVYLVAIKSNHMIQHDEPQLVIDAVRRIHTAVKTGASLV